jgi:hypothetical protein
MMPQSGLPSRTGIRCRPSQNVAPPCRAQSISDRYDRVLAYRRDDIVASRRIGIRRDQGTQRASDQLLLAAPTGMAERLVDRRDDNIVGAIAGLFQDDDDIVGVIQRFVQNPLEQGRVAQSVQHRYRLGRTNRHLPPGLAPLRSCRARPQCPPNAPCG